MGHYWSEMASTDEMERHEASVAAAIRERDRDKALHSLGEYLAENPERLGRLIEMLEKNS